MTLSNFINTQKIIKPSDKYCKQCRGIIDLTNVYHYLMMIKNDRVSAIYPFELCSEKCLQLWSYEGFIADHERDFDRDLYYAHETRDTFEWKHCDDCTYLGGKERYDEKKHGLFPLNKNFISSIDKNDEGEEIMVQKINHRCVEERPPPHLRGPTTAPTDGWGIMANGEEQCPCPKCNGGIQTSPPVLWIEDKFYGLLVCEVRPGEGFLSSHPHQKPDQMVEAHEFKSMYHINKFYRENRTLEEHLAIRLNHRFDIRSQLGLKQETSEEANKIVREKTGISIEKAKTEHVEMIREAYKKDLTGDVPKILQEIEKRKSLEKNKI